MSNGGSSSRFGRIRLLSRRLVLGVAIRLSDTIRAYGARGTRCCDSRSASALLWPRGNSMSTSRALSPLSGQSPPTMATGPRMWHCRSQSGRGNLQHDVADTLAGLIRAVAGIERVDVAGPGFLNIVLKSDAAGQLAWYIVQAGASFGRAATKQAERINLEFVSANPTGPIHIGGTRWAAVGDSLARILRRAGRLDVTREYYFNDHGAQIDRFARQSRRRAPRRADAPEDGYGGQLHPRHRRAVEADYHGDLDALPSRRTAGGVPRLGCTQMFGEIQASLHDVRRRF